LDDIEVEWCLKSRAIWLNKGDENTKFHAFAKCSTIKLMERGHLCLFFQGLGRTREKPLPTLFKAIKSQYCRHYKAGSSFPRFVDEEGIDLFGKLKPELKEMLHNFQKDKILARMGGLCRILFGVL
jgi:hypothetical protein